MALTGISIESNVQVPLLGGGFLYNIMATCTTSADAVLPLEPILTAAGLVDADVTVTGLQDIGAVQTDNGGNALTAITDGTNKIEYRIITNGVAGSTAPGAVVLSLRLVVVG